MGSLQIDTLGTSFAIQANEDDEYLQKLLGYYTKLTEQIEKSNSLTDNLQISILAGIMLCDELYKEKSKRAYSSAQDQEIAHAESEKEEEIMRKINDTISKIDRVLHDGV